jgi:DNA-binding transcriptional MerR regulator
VSHSSLHFLEREGLIDPVRTPGGHRLYRPADVDRLRQIKAWQRERLSLAEIRARLDAQATVGDPAALTDRFLAAALAGSPVASRLVLEADDLGVPLVAIFQAVLHRAQTQVGAQWADGSLRVGQEHEITEVVRDLIAELSLRHAHPHPAGWPVLAACVAGERHDLGLRMIVALLRAPGCRVHFLGADVEPRFLTEGVATRRPAAVLLSATLPERLPAIQAAAAALREVAAPNDLPVVVGGEVARAHRAELAQWGVVPADDDLGVTLQMILDLTDAVGAS